MNSLITRLQRRSRVAIGSSMAVVVALPLAAALGMSASAAAAADTDRASRPASTSTTAKTSSKPAKAELPSTPLAEAVPWTADPKASREAAAAGDPFKALVFSETAAFRHSNIDEATTAIQQLGAANNFTVTTSEDSSVFNDANLAQYKVVIFLSTTGDVLTTVEQAAFERYIQAGGGYAGIHAASDTEYDWPWYGNLVGAYFNNHPNGTPTATVKVEDPSHPSTKGLPKRWERTDEWYNFRTPNNLTTRNKLHVLASMDETTYTPGTGANGRRAPDRLVPGLRRWPQLVHRHGPHRGHLHRPEVPRSTSSAASRPLPVSCRRTARPPCSPASRRSRSTRTRPTRWSSPSPRTVGCSTSTAPAR